MSEDLNKITELELQNSILKAMFVYETKNSYGMFQRGPKAFDLPQLDSFAKYKFLLDTIKEGVPSSDTYTFSHARHKLISTLLSNSKYAEKGEADFEAEYALEFFQKGLLSKKDLATLARHLIIDSDTYLENIKDLSVYFNTLKKNNPDLKDSSVKLMNEVLGAKTKKASTKQEKLERREGLLYAYKQFTPQEIADYSDSFDWSRMLGRWNTHEPDKNGCLSYWDQDVIDYLYPDGHLKRAMKARFSYYGRSSSIDQTIVSAFSNLGDTRELTYPGNTPMNHVFAMFETHVKNITSVNFKDFVNRLNIDMRTSILGSYRRIVDSDNNPAYSYWPKLLLNLDFNEDLKKEDIYKFFIPFAYIDCLLDRKVGSFSYDRKTLSEMLDSAKRQPYYSGQNILKDATRCFNDGEITAVDSQAILLAKKVFAIYERILNNPKTKEFILSDKYWTEFNTVKEIQKYYNDGTPYSQKEFRNVNEISIEDENKNRIIFIIPEVWESLENCINNS